MSKVKRLSFGVLLLGSLIVLTSVVSGCSANDKGMPKELCSKLASLSSDLSGDRGFLSSDELLAHKITLGGQSVANFENEELKNSFNGLKDSYSRVLEILDNQDVPPTDANALDEIKTVSSELSKLWESCGAQNRGDLDTSRIKLENFHEFGYWAFSKEVTSIGETQISATAFSIPDSTGRFAHIFLGCRPKNAGIVFQIGINDKWGNDVLMNDTRKTLRVRLGSDKIEEWSGDVASGYFYPLNNLSVAEQYKILEPMVDKEVFSFEGSTVFSGLLDFKIPLGGLAQIKERFAIEGCIPT